MMTINDLKASIADNMDERVAQVCLAIIDRMANMEPAQMERLTYRLLAHMAHRSVEDKIFQSAVTTLTSAEHHPLVMYFLFYDEAENREVSVSSSDAMQSVRDGYFIHPRTGEEIYEFTKLLIPAFKPSTEFLRCITTDGD
ncbi:hypothetical protein [Acetobacter okinawensis]|uniref:hypothetical protein n=1 Tax=Acetobacter okinawensis TaxID=1076594 RepID=UPI00209E4506|nr:hypothetical protein [Acetobacter okinawensis]MCP1214306.1 hypothetical protein [Acetobacter okinawensis]